MTECSYKSKLQKMLYSETVKMSKYLEEMKKQEFAKIKHHFEELRKELDKKEKQMKAMYEEQVGDVEQVLSKDINILKNRLDEFSIIERKLRQKAENFRMSNDLAIVANAYEVFDLQRKIKNNNFEGKRLDSDDDDGLVDSQRLDESGSVYYKQNKNRSKLGTFHEKEINRIKQEDDNGEHIFFVQLASEFPLPTIWNNLWENTTNDLSKMMPESNMNPIYRPPLHQISAKKNQKQIHDFISNYPAISASFHSKRPHQNPIPEIPPKLPPSTFPSAQIIHPSPKEIEVVNCSSKKGQQMFWFKWDTYDSLKFDFTDSQWKLHSERPSQKFLYFSSTVHLEANGG